MPYANYLPEEVESRGELIYEQEIRKDVEAGNKGKFVVIDIETGEYEVDEDDLQATKRGIGGWFICSSTVLNPRNARHNRNLTGMCHFKGHYLPGVSISPTKMYHSPFLARCSVRHG